MTRPRLLDLFCGAGGAAMGYHRAGFDVVGVDINPQPHYPFEFIQGDVIEMGIDPRGFDAIHASPPCQAYSRHVSSRSSEWAGTRGKDEPRLIVQTRALLIDSGLPFVIENVVGARDELHRPTLLCGQMFYLPINRHRLFETSFVPAWTDVPRHVHWTTATAYAINHGWDPRDMTVTGKGRRAGTKERWAEIMGWPEYQGTQHGLREAIPPSYTEWIGAHLLAAVGERAA